MATKPHVVVSVRSDESIERALKRFKRLCESAGIRKIVRAKRYYEKPSEARRRESLKRIRNRRRADKKVLERKQRKLQRADAQRRSRASIGAGGMPPGPNSATPPV